MLCKAPCALKMGNSGPPINLCGCFCIFDLYNMIWMQNISCAYGQILAQNWHRNRPMYMFPSYTVDFGSTFGVVLRAWGYFSWEQMRKRPWWIILKWMGSRWCGMFVFVDRGRTGSWTSYWPFRAKYTICKAWGGFQGKWIFPGEIFLPILGWRY